VLTAAGIALSVAFGVGTLALTEGYRRNFIEGYGAMGTHMIVSKVSRDSPLPRPFDASVSAEIQSIPGVEGVSGMYWDLMSVDSGPARVVFGQQENSFRERFLKIVQGSASPGDPDSACLGVLAAHSLAKGPGDWIEVEGRWFRVSGIFERDSPVDNSAVILPLSSMQQMLGLKDKINFLNLRLGPDVDREGFERIRSMIQARFRGLRACGAEELFSENAGARAAMAMSVGMSLLALAVGTLGILNSVLMSVHERRREIGTLLAVGWRPARIVAMILWEAVLVSLGGAVAGIMATIILLELLTLFGPLAGRLVVVFSPMLIGGALGVAAVAGLLGGWLPAVRAAGLLPAMALERGAD
jgi:putative ABC transport system permease protein